MDASPTFTGFTEDAVAFYEGLEADNSKTYWTNHRKVYEEAVHGPMLVLLAGLEAEFGPAKIFRPHRDVRFSADKSPYKTHAAAVLHPDDGAGALYVQISAGGMVLGGGYYHMAKDQLSRYRAAVAEDRTGGRLQAVTDSLVAQGMTLAGEQLSRAPRGIDPAHPRIGLLRHKGLAAVLDAGAPDWLSTPACLDAVAGTWRQVAPLNAWLAAHVGPAEQADVAAQTSRVRR